jgi:uncharacterized membrane protein (UPF0136 family)
VAEVLALLASPGIFYVVLRLRGMAPVELPDPSMHTTYIIDPRDILTRYAAVFAPTARLREAARVGFLVPGRTAYLAFGAVGGFFALRYVLALVAVVPLYVLLKRLSGRWAGFAAVAVVLASPVFVTAWGTDYPDSAAISYLTGALCALAMPATPRRRPWWLLLAGSLLTLAVWSHLAAVPLGAAMVLSYAAVRLLRSRDHLPRDTAVLAGTAVAVTGLLSLFSWLLLGQANFWTPTWQAVRYLDTPAQERLWHSANWHWVLYDPWLLVPPAVLAVFVVVFARRAKRIGTPQLVVGLASLLAFGVAAALQFASHVQMLEMAYFSSMLWSFVAVLVALTLAELAAPFVELTGPSRRHRGASRSRGRWQEVPATLRHALPLVLLVAVALAYEADPHVPAMRLDGWGAVVAAIVVAAALIWRLGPGLPFRGGHRRRSGTLRAGAGLLVFVVFVGAALVVTVAPQEPHRPLPNTSLGDKPTAYAGALGGSDVAEVDRYQVTSELPGFVGRAAYPGEQLLTWWPEKDLGALIEPIGIFHAAFNEVGGPFPNLISLGVHKIEYRRPAQILLMSTTGDKFLRAVEWLQPYRPVTVRTAILSDGTYHLHVWLIDLGRYLRRPAK